MTFFSAIWRLCGLINVGYGKDVYRKGINSTQEDWNGCKYGRHAEMDVLKKLPPIKGKRKKKIDLDLLVVRVTRVGNLANSKPCFKCIRRMFILQQNGYRIRKVYYSGQGGIIIETTLNDLMEENQHVSRRFR